MVIITNKFLRISIKYFYIILFLYFFFFSIKKLFFNYKIKQTKKINKQTKMRDYLITLKTLVDYILNCF